MRIAGVLYTSIFLTACLCYLHLSQYHSFYHVSFSGLLNWRKQSAIVMRCGRYVKLPMLFLLLMVCDFRIFYTCSCCKNVCC